METLAQTDDFAITLHHAAPRTKDILVITFGGQPAGMMAAGFGTDFCLLGGYDTIYVAQKFGTQYQGLSLEEFETTVAPIAAKYSDVICYGPSLGGYASFYYGGTVNARIITAAPLLPAWPHLKNNKYADIALTHRDMQDVPRSNKQPIVFYDPYAGQDKANLEEILLPCYPELRRIEIPFGDHPVFVALAQAHILRPLIYHLFETGEVMEFEPPGEGTPIWHRQRAQYNLRTDPESAKLDLIKSLELQPSRSAFNQLIRCLIDLGYLSEAQERLDAVHGSTDKAYKLFPPIAKLVLQKNLNI